MKVKISKEELLKGLGDTERVVLKRYTIKDFYYFEGLPVDGYSRDGMKIHPKAMEYAKKYPELIILGKIEFQIFCAIYDTKNGIHCSELTRYLTNPESPTRSNTVCSHLAGIRRKLKGFKIENIRSPMNPSGGTYKATKLT